MQPKFYYQRDAANRPVVTVCLIKNESGGVARGTAICSPSDNPHKKTGRLLAFDRAVWALVHKSPVKEPIMRFEALVTITDCDCGLGYFKSQYNPVLTDFEKRLVSREESWER